MSTTLCRCGNVPTCYGEYDGDPPARPGPPGHVLAAGRYAASFRDRDPLQARVADLPAEWRAVVQHGARTEEERARFRQHREALGVFLAVLVQGVCAQFGMRVPGVFPTPAQHGLDLRQAEIEAIAGALHADDTTGQPGRFPAVLGLWCEGQLARWAATAQAQQAQGVQPQRAKLLTPADPGFASANREERRRRGVGRGR